MSLPRRLQTAARLSFADKVLTARAGFWTAVIAAGIRVAGFKAVTDRLGICLDRDRVPAEAPPAANFVREVWAARLYSPRDGRGRCLRESLVLARLLRRHDPVLVIGVSRADGFEAHAWVEVDGRPITNPGAFVPLRRAR